LHKRYNGGRALPAQGIYAKPHSADSGLLRRFKILRALKARRDPLNVPEIMRATGLPRRTVYYYLDQLLAMGLVRRVGRGLYAITRRGVYVVERLRSYMQERGVCANTGRLLGVLSWSGRGRRGFWVRVSGNEVGFRVRFGWVRRVLGVVGVRVRRLRYHHIYSRNGIIHFDSRHSWAVAGEAESLGLFADRDGILAILVLVLAMVKGMGYSGGFVRVLWELVPELVPY